MAPSNSRADSSRNPRVVSPLLALAAGLLLVSGCAGASSGPASQEAPVPPLLEPGTYAIDPPHTFVYFAAQHMVVGMVRGRFDKMTGTITVARDPGACTVEVEIEAASVDTQNSVRDEDLRSPAFFDAAKYPKIHFRGRGIQRAGTGWAVEGTLSIHGVTRAVLLHFSFKGVAPQSNEKPRRIAFHADAAVKRADFGMIRELLEEIGKPSSNPDVWIDIDAELLATAPPK
jgi:polyisoprenoid-binding protein YceI